MKKKRIVFDDINYRTDWWDDHVEVIGSTKKNNKKIKEKIKKDFIKEFTHKGRKTI